MTRVLEGRLDPSVETYLKIVVTFDSSATLQQVIDAWTLPPGPTGVDLFETQLSGYLNANYNVPVINLTKSKIGEISVGRFQVYNKTNYTFDSFKGGTNFASKDATLNALKGVFNGKFQPPPVQYSNPVFHIHKSWGTVSDEPFGTDRTVFQNSFDAVIV